ncbi:MAG: hypothetical protein A2Z15_07040 [Chloroflexi bacterium RBG_16_50_11]|nr:MAG: hypothetical protein A2Z15_07040 [Chloroflexi bacterium RBG_16_50_11]
MHELEKQNTAITAEADKILYERGLLKILGKFGETFVTGSYTLKLMLRRDLDVNISCDTMTEKKFFQMGGEIAAALKPARILYINEYVVRHPRLPLGYYFGVSLGKKDDPQDWNIDIWSMDTDQFNQNKRAIINLKSAIDSEKRLLILDIKNKSLDHPWYQRSFFSMDIYNAVISEDVKTTEEFFEWVKQNKSTDISI